MTRTGRFMIDKRWLEKPKVLEIVREGWSKESLSDRKGFMERIFECSRALSKWKSATHFNSKPKIKSLRENLETEGIKLFSDLNLMKIWRWELPEAYLEEETYWKLRIREK